MVRIEVIPNRDILNIMDYDEISFIQDHGDLFREFCLKKKVPISLPYRGGHHWAVAISKLGHIAIVEESFRICAYAFYKLNGEQRGKIAQRQARWREYNFAGVITNEEGILHNFDAELLKTTNDGVIDRFVSELKPVAVRPKVQDERARFKTRVYDYYCKKGS